MKEILVFFRHLSEWLHFTVFEYNLIYIDLWSFVHVLAGAIVFASLSTLKWKKRWLWLLFFLSAFEIVEATLFISLLRLFQPEKIPDVFMDIILGMGGGNVMYLLFEKIPLKRAFRNWVVMLVSTVTIAFFWTGYYGYEFSLNDLNGRFLKLITFLFWTLTGVLILLLYRFLKMKSEKEIYVMGTLYVIFYLFLLLINLITHRFLNIEEISRGNSFYLFGFFQLNPSLIFFYITGPWILIMFDNWL
ncbi:MAG: hypothetical protein JW798_13710, partial [Prolixibacteraceae bacterium]|nr:hypothetical protein [Prolixibacteraceae bacterium]